MNRRSSLISLGVVAVVALWGATSVRAADLIIFANQGAASGIKDLAEGYQKATGNKVTLVRAAGAEFMKKIMADEPGDVVTGFYPEGMDDFVKRGKAVAGTAVEFARAGNGVAVKEGARKWDISTVEGFKRAMLEAKSIGHSNAGTGPYNKPMFEKLGIYDQIKDKIKIVEGKLVAAAVNDGDVEIGIQQTNVIQPYKGTVYLGPLPAELMQYGRFGAAVLTVSKDKDGAKALIKYMADPANEALVRKSAMVPPAR